jgi:hypothetical protein
MLGMHENLVVEDANVGAARNQFLLYRGSSNAW